MNLGIYDFPCRLPTPLAVLVSAAVFAGAHLTPGEFPQLFVLGIYSYLRHLSMVWSSINTQLHVIWVTLQCWYVHRNGIRANLRSNTQPSSTNHYPRLMELGCHIASNLPSGNFPHSHIDMTPFWSVKTVASMDKKFILFVFHSCRVMTSRTCCYKARIELKTFLESSWIDCVRALFPYSRNVYASNSQQECYSNKLYTLSTPINFSCSYCSSADENRSNFTFNRY